MRPKHLLSYVLERDKSQAVQAFARLVVHSIRRAMEGGCFGVVCDACPRFAVTGGILRLNGIGSRYPDLIFA